jgi:hypothetical protein
VRESRFEVSLFCSFRYRDGIVDTVNGWRAMRTEREMRTQHTLPPKEKDKLLTGIVYDYKVQRAENEWVEPLNFKVD